MDIDQLIQLLNEKISLIEQEQEESQRKKQEINSLHSIVAKLIQDPFAFYQFDDEQTTYITRILDFTEEDKVRLAQTKEIYDGYKAFNGGMPQIDETYAFIKEICDRLGKYDLTLADELVKCTHAIQEGQKYRKLFDLLKNEEIYFFNFELLNKVLSKLALQEEDKNQIKLAINDRNIRIYQRELNSRVINENLTDVAEQEENLGRSEDEVIPSILGQLLDSELQSFKDIYNKLLSFQGEELVAELKKYSGAIRNFSDRDMVDAFIFMKEEDILEYKKLFGDDEVSDEISRLENDVDCLSEYRGELIAKDENIDQEEENYATSNKLERALAEYQDDFTKYPVLVLYLNPSISRDIDSIEELQTLEDCFIMLENFKKGDKRCLKKLCVSDAYELKPTNAFGGGRQGRCSLIYLGENTYGLLYLEAKKKSNATAKIKTKMPDARTIETLKRSIKMQDAEVLAPYYEQTKRITEQLKSTVEGYHYQGGSKNESL